MATNESLKNKLETRSPGQVKTVFDYFEHRKKEIEAVLPKHITPERIIGILSAVIKGNPTLAACSQISLISAVIQSVQLGLEPGPLGHCAFIPYAGNVQFQIMYKGYKELLFRTGKVSKISARAVFEKDKFCVEYGLVEVLEHVPCMLSDPGKSIAYYAVVTMADGEKVFDVMSRDQVDAIKKRSKAVQGGKPTPWDTDYEEMAKKTVFKRLAKLLPLSPDVAIAFSADETTKNTISPNIAEDIDVTDWSLSDAEPASQPLADATGKTPEPETKPPIQPLPSVSPVDTGTQGKPFSPRLKLATQSQLDKLSQLFLDCRMTPETQASFVAEYGNGVSRATDMSLMSAEALLDHLKGLAKGFMGNEKQ